MEKLINDFLSLQGKYTCTYKCNVHIDDINLSSKGFIRRIRAFPFCIIGMLNSVPSLPKIIT